MADSEDTQSGGEEADITDVLEEQFEVNKEGKLVKKRDTQAKYTKGEMSVIWHYIENRYQELYGEGKGSNIAYNRSAIWQEFASEVDKVEGGKNQRTVKRVWKCIDNMKYLARKKNTAWTKKRTGNQKIAYFNAENLRVLAILGDTVAYSGICGHGDDMPIQMSTNNPLCNEANAQQCQAEIIAETPAITQASNIGGCSVEISDMLARLNDERKEKDEQIKRLQEIHELAQNVCGPIKSVPSTVKFPHAVKNVVEITALPLAEVPAEAVIPVDLDPSEPEGTQSQEVIPPTQQSAVASTSSQIPLTDTQSVASKSVKGKPKGRAAKRQRLEEELNAGTNTAATYLDVETSEPVSANAKGIPAYLLRPAPTMLQTEDLRKHVMISDIEKNRALTRLANKICAIMPRVNSVLRKFDPTENDNSADHTYETQD